MYLRMFTTLRQLGFKKTAVKIAFFTEEHTRNGSKLYEAAQGYVLASDTGFPRCEVCWTLVLPDMDSEHESCQEYLQYEQQRLEDEERDLEEYYEAERKREADQRHYDDLMESFCEAPDCYEPHEKYYYTCAKHAPEEECRTCERPESQCSCADDIEDDFDDEDEICEGICGQLARHCTCAETESFRAFHADPATAGSYWVA